jgi:hypothetical protein
MLPEPAYRSFNDPLLQEMDAGFDPLNLATTPSPWGDGQDAYFNYREAEVKHGRLAMLASVGWLTSEELRGPWRGSSVCRMTWPLASWRPRSSTAAWATCRSGSCRPSS